MKRFLLAAVMMCPVGVRAETLAPVDIKPGLWENTITSQMSGPTTLQGSPQTRTIKVCITREQLNQPLFDSGAKSCTYKLVSSSASSQNVHAECVLGNTATVGDFKLERVDSEHLKADGVMKLTGDSSTKGSVGENMTIKMSFRGRFLASDCGDVKPSESDK